MQVVDAVVRLLLKVLALIFMLGVLSSMAVIGQAVLRDALDPSPDRSLFTIGPHGRNALAVLKRWMRPLLFVWATSLLIGVAWIVIHIFVEYT